MRIILQVVLLLISFSSFGSDCVVLLHGLARSAAAMETMQQALDNAGYYTVNVDYPSRNYPVETLSAMAIPPALAKCEANNSERIHFVTHSMGGILLRDYLKDHRIAVLGRVVMLGPPNQGSEVVDTLKDIPGFEAFNGPAGMQLGTSKTDIPRQLPEVDFELGVIAGTRSINLMLSTMLPNPDDGKVSVANTYVNGMCAHVSIAVSHPYLMKRQAGIKQTLYFLQNGRFFGEEAKQFDCPAQSAL
ncbi:esterase/lipase family protein [Alishewanella tabrizica]|uniref:Acetyltransferase n=1 Tax=Alishewanella tabrizica TaxID=671278 RepID=A0ABQ2WME7_9ALTE|nr:alpha/beta fold hydrolase [Alishewanella tabrizica]GGW59140.1 acetyltransferase [Alishewanella tabrizica]